MFIIPVIETVVGDACHYTRNSMHCLYWCGVNFSLTQPNGADLLNTMIRTCPLIGTLPAGILNNIHYVKCDQHVPSLSVIL